MSSSPNSRAGRAASSVLFKMAESFGTQIVSLLISIVLGRLLTPEDYGVLSILLVFISIGQVFVQSGLNTALVQKKEVDQVEITSVFATSLGISLVMYIVLFLCAPFIAEYYHMPELCAALRVLALMLIPGAVVAQQQALIARRMLFGRSMVCSLIAVVCSGVIGILLACRGLKHWALVWQQLSYNTLLAILLSLRVGWKPGREIALSRIKGMLRFGRRILLSGLLDTGYSELRTLVIGKRYTTADLGNYTKGKQFPQLIITALDNSVQSVMLPVLSECQDDKAHMRELFRLSLMTMCAIAFPVMAGLAAVAKPLIGLLLGENWLGCVVFLQICCLDFALNPVHLANLQAINAQGHSDIFLKLELIKKAYGLPILLITVLCFHSVEAIVWGGVVSSLLSLFVNGMPNRRLLDYGPLKQIRDILPSFLTGLVMFCCVWPMSLLPLSYWLLLPLQVVSGVGIYVGLNLLFHVEAFRLLRSYGAGLLRKMAILKKTGNEEKNV